MGYQRSNKLLTDSHHSNFLNDVHSLINNDGTYTGCADNMHHTTCAFGKWYYFEGSRFIVEQGDESVKQLWADIGKVHHAFHESACRATPEARKAYELEILKMKELLVRAL